MSLGDEIHKIAALPAPPIGGPTARADGIIVSRGRRRVLNGMSLALDPSSVTVLLGPNGAGKTTLLRAFCGGVPLEGGSLAVAGGDPRRDRAARAAIGFVPQEIALYPRLTVRENLETFAALSGRAGRDRRAPVAEALDRTGLTDVAHRLVAVLSGGMQRRVNLACALLGAPRLLLLDEPAVGLDVEARAAMALVLRRLAVETGCAVLLTTHHVAEAEMLADRVVLIDDGRVVASGEPKALIARTFPANATCVDALLAAPAGPRLDAALREQGFAPAPGGSLWRGVMDGAPEHRLALLHEAGAADGALREIRVRRPGLEDVYLRLLPKAAGA